MKKLYRSKDRKIAGLVGGIAEYFEIDPTVLRVGALFALFATGIVPAIVTYFLALFIVPPHPKHEEPKPETQN